MTSSFGFDSSGRLTVTGVDVQITDLIPGVGATKLGKAEDAAAVSGDTLVGVAAVRRDAAASSSGTDGDYSTFNLDATGGLWLAGSQAEDAAAVSGDRGLFMLGQRKDTAASTAGTDGDYAGLTLDALGLLRARAAHDLTLIKWAPTVDTAAYSANDIVGGIQTIANFARVTGGSGKVQQLSVFDVSNQKKALSLLFFDATPAGGTYTDNGAVTWHANDPAKFIGKLEVAAADYVSFGAQAVASYKNLNLPLTVAATSLFALIITTEAPDYVAATDLHMVLGVEY